MSQADDGRASDDTGELVALVILQPVHSDRLTLPFPHIHHVQD